MIVCSNCGRSIMPVKEKFSIGLFIILTLLWVFPAVIYLIIYMTRQENTCPCCQQSCYIKKAEPYQSNNEEINRMVKK